MARDVNQDHVLMLRQEGKVKALQDLLAVIAIRYPNFSMLEASLKEKNGQYLYEVEFLTAKGVARSIKIDAVTAKILDDRVDN